MSADEKIRLTLETVGTESVKQAAKSISDLEASVDSLDDSIKSGVIKSSGEFWLTLKDGQKILANTSDGFRKLIDDESRFLVTLADGSRVWNDSIPAIKATNDALRHYQEVAKTASFETDTLVDEMEALRSSVADGVAKPMERFLVTLKDGRKVFNDTAEGMRHLGVVAGKDGKFGSGMLQAAFFVDDLQYGLHSIVNNVPIMAQYLGLGATTAGALGIAFVGLNVAVTQFNKLTTDTSIPNLKDLETGHAKASASARKHEETLKELEKTVPQTAAEYEKYADTIKRLTIAKEELTAATQASQIAEKDAKKESEAAGKEKKALAEAYDQVVNKSGESGQLQESLRNQIVNRAVEDRAAMADRAIATGNPMVRTRTPDGRVRFQRADQELRDVFNDLRGQGANMTLPRQQVMQMARDEVVRRARGKATPLAKTQVDKLVADIQGAGTKEDQDAAMAKLRQLDPSTAAAIGTEITAGRMTDGADARISEVQKAVDVEKEALSAGERAGAAMLPNAGMLTDEQNRQREASLNAGMEASARNAAIRNEVLSRYDPTTLAAMRYRQYPQNARIRNAMQARDTQGYAQEFMARGMSESDAMEAAQQSISGGNRSLQDYAAQIDKTLANGVRAFEVAGSFLQQQQARLAEMEARQSMMVDQLNQMSNSQPRVRPQQFRARQ